MKQESTESLWLNQIAMMQAWTFRKGLLASFLVHLLFAAPFGMVQYWAHKPQQPNKLVVELFGMIAERQTEELHSGKQIASPPATRAPQAAHPPQAASPPSPKTEQPMKRAPVDSPVKTSEVREEAEALPPPAAAEPPRPAGAAPEDSIRQTIRHEDLELDAQRRFLAALKKAVKAKLSYPSEAHGATGAPTVVFRLAADGSIEPGSLMVRASSGNAVLDEQAMRAVRAVMPYDPPPRAMTIALDIPFSVETK